MLTLVTICLGSISPGGNIGGEYWWSISPGANIGGDCLAASSPASSPQPYPPSSHCSLSTSSSLPRFLFLAICQVSPSLVLWPVLARGRAKLLLPKSRPQNRESPAVRGSTLLGPAQGDPYWEKNVARVTRPIQGGAEDVKITASIISCCHWPAPPTLFRFYELAKRWLRLFSSWWLIKFGTSNVKFGY